MTRVKSDLIGGNESYNSDDNVTVIVQVHIKEKFDFNHNFNCHFSHKLLVLLSLLLEIAFLIVLEFKRDLICAKLPVNKHIETHNCNNDINYVFFVCIMYFNGKQER